MPRSRSSLDVPTDPRLLLASRVKRQSATPSVPSTPLGPTAGAASTSSAATPLHGPAAPSPSPLLDPLGIKRSSSVQSWADQRTLMKQESPIPGIDLNQIFFTRDARLPCGHCREVLPRSNFSSRQLSQAQSKQRTAHIRRKEVTISGSSPGLRGAVQRDELNVSIPPPDLPLCDACCGVQQRNSVYCSECKKDKAPSDFSHAMVSEEEILRGTLPLVPRPGAGSDRIDAACSESSHFQLDAEIEVFCDLLSTLEKDVWAAADGGVGSSDSEEDDNFCEKTTTAPSVVNPTGLQRAYARLDEPAVGQGQILYDSSDDD
ncbi:hypothetical protein B0A53_02333 [Rhodotorula sp. CCFEE 5036]|nr:hypothetical protein B0A53_02333 [Rhodotorula sp. CCFEE 5036]